MEMMRGHSRNILALAVVTMAALALATSANAFPLWNPTTIPTELWLDAAEASTVTETSGQVSRWGDRSGNGRDATQGTAANQPDYVAGGQNGLNVVRLTEAPIS